MAKNPWSRAAKPKPKGKLTMLGGKAKTNGKAPVKPSLAALTKGKPAKATPKPKPNLRRLTGEPVAIERPYQEPKPRVKEDFRVGGLLFSGAEIDGQMSAGYRDGMFRSFGSVDVTNGDQTYSFHNRYGSWMHNVYGSEKMAEPARVASWLGINISQLDLCQLLTKRFEAELKKQGIPTMAQQRAQRDMDATQARKRTKQPEKETIEVSPKKLSLKGLKK